MTSYLVLSSAGAASQRTGRVEAVLAEKYRVAAAAGPSPGIEMGDFKIDYYWQSLAIDKVWKIGSAQG